MAGRLTFERWVEDGVHTYRYVAHEGPLIEKRWKGLSEEWPNEPPPELRLDYQGDVGVYLGLIWRLTRGLLLYGVPRFHRDAGMHRVGSPYALIDWEYEVANEEGPELGTIRGFVPARSSVRIWPPAGPWKRENEKKAGFFELAVFDVLRDVQIGLMGDACAELNLYALSKADYEVAFATYEKGFRRAPFESIRDFEPPVLPGVTQTIAALQGSEPPRLGSLLAPGEMLIDLSLGIDLGYADVIVIHSTTDLSERLDLLTEEYEAAVESYEQDVEGIKSPAEFVERLGRLLNLDGEASQ